MRRKMAARTLMFLKCPANLVFLRRSDFLCAANYFTIRNDKIQDNINNKVSFNQSHSTLQGAKYSGGMEVLSKKNTQLHGVLTPRPAGGIIYLIRSLQNAKYSLKIYQCSFSKSLKDDEKPPVKFSTSSASKISIAETTGLEDNNTENKIKRFVILCSLGLFLLYFCVIREENDMDEILGGNPEHKSEEAELVELKLKLGYCEKNHLPTANLKARIEEIVERHKKPVFQK